LSFASPESRSFYEKRAISTGIKIILDSVIELVERVVASDVIGVVKKFVVNLLVMRTIFASPGASWMPLFLMV
jgi:hypothetical protein